MSILSDFDEWYEDAEIHENEGFKPLPDGTYQVFVDEVCIKETQKERKPMISWKFKVTSGAYQGRILFKNSIVNENTISYIKTDLSVCDLKLNKFSDLDSRLEELLDINLEVKVSNKKYVDKKGEEKDTQNIYIQRKIVPSDDEVPSEDIPF